MIYRIVKPGNPPTVLRSYRGLTVYASKSGAKTALAIHRKRNPDAVLQSCFPEWEDVNE